MYRVIEIDIGSEKCSKSEISKALKKTQNYVKPCEIVQAKKKCHIIYDLPVGEDILDLVPQCIGTKIVGRKVELTQRNATEFIQQIAKLPFYTWLLNAEDH